MMGGSETGRLIKAVVVSKDRLRAHVRLSGAGAPGQQPLSADEVLAALQASRVQITDAVRARVAELVALCEKVSAAPNDPASVQLAEPFLVAEGQPAVEGEDGQFVWAPELNTHPPAADEGAQIDHFALTAIRSVTAGAVVGHLALPKDGQPGVDVHGAEIPPRKLKGAPVRLGPGLRPAGTAGTDVVAETGGRLAEENGTIRIYDVLEIRGDVDFNSGSIETVVDVKVHGTVRANFHVRTTGALTVDRLIEAAAVEVGGSVAVRGGIVGREGRGHVRAGGNVSASFINETRIEAGGDVLFQKEILNSQLRADGRLAGEHGTIIGGSVHAREGVHARVLGSEAGVTTVIACGTDVRVLSRARRMEQQVRDLQKAADQVRQTIQPLMANLKRLLPAQREQVTELMCKADEIELQVGQIQELREKMLADATPRGNPSIIADEVIYPGVRLRIGARQVNVGRLLHGPLKIEVRKVDDVTEIVMVNRRTASVTVLPSQEIDVETVPTDDKRGSREHETNESAVSRPVG